MFVCLNFQILHPYPQIIRDRPIKLKTDIANSNTTTLQYAQYAQVEQHEQYAQYVQYAQ